MSKLSKRYPNIDVNIRDDDGNTPLLWAVKEGRSSIQVVEALLHFGPDVDAQNDMDE
jgi:ankyrin repeat protein